MKDMLDQYEPACDPKRPLVCYDEGLKQLIEETRRGMPARSDQVERYDYEYKRNSVRNLNMAFEPLMGKCFVRITERHTRQDYAICIKGLTDELHTEAEVIRGVLGDLGSHKPSRMYETYQPEEARWIVKKLEFSYMPFA